MAEEIHHKLRAEEPALSNEDTTILHKVFANRPADLSDERIDEMFNSLQTNPNDATAPHYADTLQFGATQIRDTRYHLILMFTDDDGRVKPLTTDNDKLTAIASMWTLLNENIDAQLASGKMDKAGGDYLRAEFARRHDFHLYSITPPKSEN